MVKGARSKVWRHYEEVLLADDYHHVLCILCKQMHQSKKNFTKVCGQVGSQELRNHLRGAHPKAWRDIDQEERDEKKAKKQLELKAKAAPKIDDAFSKMNKINPQQLSYRILNKGTQLEIVNIERQRISREAEAEVEAEADIFSEEHLRRAKAKQVAERDQQHGNIQVIHTYFCSFLLLFARLPLKLNSR